MKVLFSLSLPHDASTVPVVRRTCRDALGVLKVVEDCVDDIELAVSEACTNVLKHVEGTGGEYEVKVEIDQHTCEISVVDRGVGFEYTLPRYDSGHPSLGLEGGRGIFLMDAMVDQLDFHTEPDTGTVVHLVKRLVFEEDSLLHEMGLAFTQ